MNKGFLEELVYDCSGGEAGVVCAFNNNFFSSLIRYSFSKTNLDLKKHFFPCLHLSDVLTGFSRSVISF